VEGGGIMADRISLCGTEEISELDLERELNSDLDNAYLDNGGGIWEDREMYAETWEELSFRVENWRSGVVDEPSRCIVAGPATIEA